MKAPTRRRCLTTCRIDPQALDWPFCFKRWKDYGLSFVPFFHDVLREQYPLAFAQGCRHRHVPL